MTRHELLVEARKLVAAGWTQHIGHEIIDGQDHYCLIGATACATREVALAPIVQYNHTYRGALDAIQDALQMHGYLYGIANWNDAPGRTKEQVLAVLDKAIAATAPEPALTIPTEWTAEPVREQVTA